MRYLLAGSLLAFAFARNGRKTAGGQGLAADDAEFWDSTGDTSDVGHVASSRSVLESEESVSYRSIKSFEQGRGRLNSVSVYLNGFRFFQKYDPTRIGFPSDSSIRQLWHHFDATTLISQFPSDERESLVVISVTLEEAARQALGWWLKSKKLFTGAGEVQNAEKLVTEAYRSYHEPAVGVHTALLPPRELEDAIRYFTRDSHVLTPSAKLERQFAHVVTLRICTIVQFIQEFSHYIIRNARYYKLGGMSDLAQQTLQDAERMVGLLSLHGLGLAEQWFKQGPAGNIPDSYSRVGFMRNAEGAELGSVMSGVSDLSYADHASEKKEGDVSELLADLVSRIWALRVEDMVIPDEEMNRLTEDDTNAAGSIEQAINEAAYQSLKWVVDIGGLLGHLARVNVYADTNDVFEDYAEYDADRTDLSPEEILEGRTAIESFLASGRTWRVVCELEETDYSSFVQRKLKQFARLFKKFAGALMPENRKLLTEERAAQVVTALERAEEIHAIYSSQPLGLMERWRKWQAHELVDNEPESDIDEYWRLEDERERSEEVWKSFVAERTRVEEESEQDFLNELESQPKVLKSVRHGPSINRTKAFYKRRRSVPSSLGIVDREGLPRRLKPKTRIASSMKAHVRKHNRAHSTEGESFTSESASV